MKKFQKNNTQLNQKIILLPLVFKKQRTKAKNIALVSTKYCWNHNLGETQGGGPISPISLF